MVPKSSLLSKVGIELWERKVKQYHCKVDVSDSSRSCFPRAITSDHLKADGFPWFMYTQMDKRRACAERDEEKMAERMQLLSRASFLCSMMAENCRPHTALSACARPDRF